jgi:DNA-binding transcriptional LysR family regulator
MKGRQKMNLEYYRNFIAIVESGSISKAVAQVHISQPALSEQLRTLEEEYGARLLEVSRGVHTLKLTDAGRIFYEKARALCALEDDTRREIDDCTRGITGTLRISLAPSRTPLFIKKYVTPFTKLYPGVNYELREAFHQELVADVLSGRSEIGIANAPLPDPSRFDILFARQEDIVVVGLRDNPWLQKNKGALGVQDLENASLVVTRGHYEFLLRVFREKRRVPHIFALVNMRQTALEFAEAGLGLAVVPKEKSESLAPDLCTRPYISTAHTMEKTIFKLRDKELSAPMKKFLEVYQTHL